MVNQGYGYSAVMSSGVLVENYTDFSDDTNLSFFGIMNKHEAFIPKIMNFVQRDIKYTKNKGEAFQYVSLFITFVALEKNIMKKELLLSLVGGLFTLTASAQQYEISGQAPEGVHTIYFQNLEGSSLDSTQVVNGQFSFKGDAQGHLFAILGAKENANQLQRVQVLLDGQIKVDLATGKASGNAENEGFTTWNQKFTVPQNVINGLMAEVAQYQQTQTAMPDSVNTRINRVYEEQTEYMAQLVKDCCKENSQLRFPAFFLINMASNMEKADVIALAENGNPEYMKVPVMERLKHRIQGWKKQLPGTPFTDLTLNDTQGKGHKLSEYVGKGKYILVDFWASWCGPCRQSMPELKKVYEKYKGKNFEIVGLSFDQTQTAWVNAIKKLDLPWIHLSDLKGWQSIAAETYGINSIPATLLIGPDGKIIASGLHAEELDAKLAELLK